MRIFYGNKATPAAITTIVTSSAATGYPGSNAVHQFRSNQWKTGTSSASESIEFQFPAAITVKGIVILNHDLTVADALTVQANTSSSWGSPPFTQALTIENEIKHVFGSSQTYRYWRLAMTKASSALVRSLGVVMLTSVYDTPVQPDYDGFKETLVDSSKITKAISGQTYVETLPKFYEHQLDFGAMDQTFKDNLDTICNTVGVGGQLAYQIETAGTLTKVWYMRLDKIPRFSVNGFDSSLIYSATLETEEIL